MGDIPKLPGSIVDQVRRAEYEAPVVLSSYKNENNKKRKSANNSANNSTNSSANNSKNNSTNTSIPNSVNINPNNGLNNNLNGNSNNPGNTKSSKSDNTETPVVKKAKSAVPVSKKINVKIKAKDAKAESDAKLKKVIDVTKLKKTEISEIENEQKKLQQDIDKLKQEINEYMAKTDLERIKWDGHGIKKKETVKIDRITVGDVLEVVGQKYGEPVMDQVIAEIARKHVEKNSDDYELKFISLEKEQLYY
jgi:hypothetical protein